VLIEFVYDCIFNVPESYDVEIQVMHKSTFEVLLVSNEMNPGRKETIQIVVNDGGIAAVLFVRALVILDILPFLGNLFCG
jgi:hypothetical protein